MISNEKMGIQGYVIDLVREYKNGSVQPIINKLNEGIASGRISYQDLIKITREYRNNPKLIIEILMGINAF